MISMLTLLHYRADYSLIVLYFTRWTGSESRLTMVHFFNILLKFYREMLSLQFNK